MRLIDADELKKNCACSTNPACDCYGRGLTDPEWHCPDGVRADS